MQRPQPVPISIATSTAPSTAPSTTPSTTSTTTTAPGNNMASYVVSPPPTRDTHSQTPTSGATQAPVSMPVPASVPASTSASADTYFLSQLKTQVEFYFSPANLARDTYLRGIMAQYGGTTLPLSVIASFPKVRELCATKTGNPALPAEPLLLMRAMESSRVAKISPDGYWISYMLRLPPFDRAAKRRIISSQSTLMPTGSLVRQVSVGSGPIPIPSARNSSPLSNASSGDAKSSRTTLIVSDIPTDFATEVVMSAFTIDSVIPKSARPADLNVWHVTFASEQHAQNAISAAKDKTINGLPIKAKIMGDQQPKNTASKSMNNNTTTNNSNNTNTSTSTNKPSPTTTALPQEKLGETDNNNNKNNPNSNKNTPVPQIPIQQAATQYPSVPVTHMAPPPQGMPNNPNQYPYTYTFQPPFQYPAGRYPHHLPQPNSGHAIQYTHSQPMYSHHPYQYMPSAPRPYFTTGPPPNQSTPVFIRSATDPGQMRHSNSMMKGKNNNDGRGNNNMNHQMRKNNNGKKKGQQQQQQQQQQQGYFDNSGGMNPLLPGHRMNRGSRDSLDSVGKNDFNRRGSGNNRNGGGGGGGGQSRRKNSSSPMIDHVESFDGKSKKKKKSKRRGSGNGTDWDRRKEQNKTEIFNDNMFPALSPNKAKGTNEKVEKAAPVVSNGFSGYADALRQKNKPKAVEGYVEDGKDYQLITDALENSMSALKIFPSVDEVAVDATSTEDPVVVVKSSVVEPHSISKTMTEVSDSSTNNTESNENSSTFSEVKPILSKDEPTPKEASKVEVNPVSQTETVLSEKESTITVEKDNNLSNTNVETEVEVNSQPSGVWGAKRSFKDVVKRQA